jgi:hypothetical protein
MQYMNVCFVPEADVQIRLEKWEDGETCTRY